MITRFSHYISVSNYILKFYIFSENTKKESNASICSKEANHKQWFISNLHVGLGERRLSPRDKYQSGHQLRRFLLLILQHLV